MAKMTVYILPTKTRGCAPQSPETGENDENGGCLSDKTRVCQRQGFRHPEKHVGVLRLVGRTLVQGGYATARDS